MSDFVNVGEPVTLSSGAIVNVKELTFRQTRELLGRVPEFLAALSNVQEVESPMEVFTTLFGEGSEAPKIASYVVSLVSGIPEDQVDDLAMRDVVNILTKFKDVSDLKELWENFTSLLPAAVTESFSALGAKTLAEATSQLQEAEA